MPPTNNDPTTISASPMSTLGISDSSNQSESLQEAQPVQDGVDVTASSPSSTSEAAVNATSSTMNDSPETATVTSEQLSSNHDEVVSTISEEFQEGQATAAQDTAAAAAEEEEAALRALTEEINPGGQQIAGRDATPNEEPRATNPVPEEEEEDIPVWVTYEEDTSIPDEEELKEIETSEDDKLSAADIAAMERHFYPEVEDPEQRPVKKLRLSWVIKGVRGTRDQPNYARVINSPAVFSDGLFWSINFCPRGHDGTSLSAFLRCTRERPPEDEERPESEFCFFEGSPDADFTSDIEPKARITTSAKLRRKDKKEPPGLGDLGTGSVKKPTQIVQDQEVHTDTESPPSELRDDKENNTAREAQLSSWRVSAQLGVVIYNPAEPRTKFLQSDGHQFSKHSDDWGWLNFVNQWEEIHQRQRGQRQPLLRNDTLKIDAYIRIFEDPTESLWWHESKGEKQWPSKELAGYFPMGTPAFYHSPAVAGITAWLLLAPFREVIQNADGGQWRLDPNVRSRPLICHAQVVLDQMRHLASDVFVSLHSIIEELSEAEEQWHDVKSFWEVFRRGLELELEGDEEALQKLRTMFDVPDGQFTALTLPVTGSGDIQGGVAKNFDQMNFHGRLPNFLPITLDRQRFDSKVREWKLHHDRVRLNDKLDLSKWTSDEDSSYVLYGFFVHVGGRNSGRFYSVLRPGGIGTKWLAFEDGNNNKVSSYSSKRIKEYEGLVGEELRRFPESQTRENAYMAMYIRSSCLDSYLSQSLAPYRAPKWLRPWTDRLTQTTDEDEKDELRPEEGSDQSYSILPDRDEHNLRIEIYMDDHVEGCENVLSVNDLRFEASRRHVYRSILVGKDTRFKNIRTAIAEAFKIEDQSRIQLFEIHYQGLGKCSRVSLHPVRLGKRIIKHTIEGQKLRLWLCIQPGAEISISHGHLIDRLEMLDLAVKAPEKGDEADTTSSRADDALSGGSNPAFQHENTESGPDTEQASVQAAVESTVEAAGNATRPSVSNNGSEEQDTAVALDRETAPVSQTRGATTSSIEINENEVSPPVVHGHLMDAVQHESANAEVMIEQSSANVTHGDSSALAQLLASEPEVVGLDQSTADNLEPALDNAPAVAESQVVAISPAVPSVTPSAAPPAARVYGIIQYFDVDGQKFIAQRPCHPEADVEIGVAIKESMGFDKDRQIKVWKFRGLSNLEQLQSTSTTFSQYHLFDFWILIVGDVLSEDKIEELKSAGKFWQPYQLIKYLVMSQRGHPRMALSTTEAVELADFGNDYYKGPLSRGRPHGERGLLITSTGHTYEGPFVAGLKSGPNGKMTYQNGDVYSGQWKDDERHGQGEFTEKRTGNRYVGGFENGRRWGAGTTYWQVADQQADMCQICYEEDIDALFYDCGHVCACVDCAKRCETCPVCRRSVRQVVKMYRA